ncbi:MAG: alpha/beta hydrolase [Prolixibacteraceae bacterium]
MKKIAMLVFGISLINCIFAQDENFKTLTYFQNDTLQLDLDLFLPANALNEATPLVIFAHGGGFSGGDRQSAHGLCEFLANNGIAAATMTYTLYMKESNQSFSCDGSLTEKVKAIQIGSNQFWQATAYLIEHQAEYGFNTKQVFMAGSSAGAELIYGAAYWSPQLMGLYPLALPVDFNYAGFISGAGAMLDINLINKNNMLPSLLFHGTCDTAVPYHIAPHHYCKGNVPGWLMLFGDHAVHERICSLNGKSMLISYCGGGHEYSWKPFDEERENILWFIKHAVSEEKFQIHSIIPTGKMCELSEEYDFCK